MRLKSIKISGFKPIPFCAVLNDEKPNVIWQNPFEVNFPTNQTMLSAIIGPNSSGKSSILHVLEYFFSPTSKFKPDVFNKNCTTQPIIIELVFLGKISKIQNWHREKCALVGDNFFELTIVTVWTTENRTDYIRLLNSNGCNLHKQTANDKSEVKNLLPRYRLIPAVANLSDEGNPEKKNLLADIVEEFLERTEKSSNRSIRKKIEKKLEELNVLLKRDSSSRASWKAVEEIETLLSESIAPLTPDHPKAKMTFSEVFPNINQVFQRGRVRIEDDVELDLSNHGSGLQRTFVISALNAWNQWVGQKNDNIDFFIGIEEPELYLHPHATRVCLKTFRQIAQRDQVVFTTHSSEFVNHVDIGNITRIKRTKHIRSIKSPDLTGIRSEKINKVQRYLIEDRSDMLFARAVLLVEGQSEVYAIPAFAKIIGVDLDKFGVSIVYINGKGNFEVYAQILKAFDVPFAILGDGDGNLVGTKQKYEKWCPAFVLEYDFEQSIADILSDDRLLQIVNECKKRIGQPFEKNLSALPYTARQLAKSWWNKLKDDLHGDIIAEYRILYKADEDVMKKNIQDLAALVVANGHMFPSAIQKRKAEILRNQGKPLLGRVIGDLLRKEEICKLEQIRFAIDEVVAMSQK